MVAFCSCFSFVIVVIFWLFFVVVLVLVVHVVLDVDVVVVDVVFCVFVFLLLLLLFIMNSVVSSYSFTGLIFFSGAFLFISFSAAENKEHQNMKYSTHSKTNQCKWLSTLTNYSGHNHTYIIYDSNGPRISRGYIYFGAPYKSEVSETTLPRNSTGKRK